MASKRNDYGKQSIKAHKKYRGKVAIRSKMPLNSREDLSIAYTPGVAAPCEEISDDRDKAYSYTWKGNSIAVISDGSAVLGLGNIGPEAALPVMEGKCVLFKKFADIDAVPLVLNTQDPNEVVAIVQAIAPTYGGICLEDIGTPRCFEIERRLKKALDIPVIHDDQHGTAVVTLAGLINAMKITGGELKQQKIVICGAGAAGVAIAKLLNHVGIEQIIVCDKGGIISEGREDNDAVKNELIEFTNPEGLNGELADAMEGADIFIGVSAADVLTKKMVKSMNDDPIIFAMANPDPEIMPEDAKAAGAQIIATGRSDFPNQVNNVLAFPGLFRGALDAGTDNITNDMFVAAAHGIAGCLEKPAPDNIIPSVFDHEVAPDVAEAVAKISHQTT